jgi:hypothetical protein
MTIPPVTEGFPKELEIYNGESLPRISTPIKVLKNDALARPDRLRDSGFKWLIVNGYL